MDREPRRRELGNRPVAHGMTPEDVFALRDAYLAEHPDVERMMHQTAWFAWAKRQMRPQDRIMEQRWDGGRLVSERDVTPPDPEPVWPREGATL